MIIAVQIQSSDNRYILLSRDPQDGDDFHQRICLHAEIVVENHPIHIFVTHLSLSYVS